MRSLGSSEGMSLAVSGGVATLQDIARISVKCNRTRELTLVPWYSLARVYVDEKSVEERHSNEAMAAMWNQGQLETPIPERGQVIRCWTKISIRQEIRSTPARKPWS